MNQKQYLLPDVNMTSFPRRRSSLPNPEAVEDIDSIHVKVSPTPSVNGDYQLKPTHKDGYIGTLEEHEALRKNYHSALNPDARYRITVSQTSAIKNLKPQEINLAVTLVAISLLFICCQSIKIIPDVYEMIYCNHFELASKVTDNELEKICQVPTWIDAIVSVANLSCCINSAGNFILASTICSLIGEVTITSINGDYIREVMVTSKNATICSLILVTLILVTSKK